MRNKLKMRMQYIVLGAALMTLVSGCGNNNDITETVNHNEPLKKHFIYVDSKTVSGGGSALVENSDNEHYSSGDSGVTIDNGSAEKQDEMFTLKLTGVNVEMDWEVSESGDVTRNGVTFYSLSSLLDNHNLPCEKNTIIKFIVSTFNAENDYVLCDMEDVDLEEDPDSASILYDEIRQAINYDSIVEDYGAEVEWVLTIYENGFKHYGRIYGCGMYLMCEGIGDDREVIYESNVDEITDNKNLNEEEMESEEMQGE